MCTLYYSCVEWEKLETLNFINYRMNEDQSGRVKEYAFEGNRIFHLNKYIIEVSIHVYHLIIL